METQTTPILTQDTHTTSSPTQTHRLFPFSHRHTDYSHSHIETQTISNLTQTTPILTQTWRLLPFSLKTHRLPPLSHRLLQSSLKTYRLLLFSPRHTDYSYFHPDIQTTSMITPDAHLHTCEIKICALKRHAGLAGGTISAPKTQIAYSSHRLLPFLLRNTDYPDYSHTDLLPLVSRKF